MDQQIYEVPVELILHGTVKVRAVDQETAERVVKKMKNNRLKKFFKEDFCFKQISNRHVVEEDEVQGSLEKTDGQEDDNDVPSDGDLSGEQEAVSPTVEEDGSRAEPGDQGN